MRLFVTEFITGGGIANNPLPESLKQEGQLMLNAVLNDCARINNVQLVTTIDKRISFNVENVEVHEVEDAIDYMQQLVLISRQCDAVWVIAPESEGILETIVTQLTNEKVTLINCDPQSISIASDKLLCAEHLIEHNICTARNLALDEAAFYSRPVMIKNRFGVGCEGLKRYESGQQALQEIEDFSQWVIQPYIEGEHLSISILFSDRQATSISLNEQVFTYENKQPKLKACLVNARAINDDINIIVDHIFHALPGLKGYVGVDVIETKSGYCVVDINPRLTSSYVGLCDVLVHNPAELCINSVLTSDLPQEIMKNNQVVEVCVA